MQITDPWEDADAATNQAAALMRCNRFREAIAVLRAALERSPRSLCLHINLATALVSIGENAEALAVAQRGLALPSAAKRTNWYVALLISGGIAARRLGEIVIALDFLTRALDRDPKNPLAHLHLGRTYADAGVCPRAVHHIVTALAISAAPVDKDAKRSDHAESAAIYWARATLAQEEMHGDADSRFQHLILAARAIREKRHAHARALLAEILATTTDDLERTAAAALLTNVRRDNRPD